MVKQECGRQWMAVVWLFRMKMPYLDSSVSVGGGKVAAGGGLSAMPHLYKQRRELTRLTPVVVAIPHV